MLNDREQQRSPSILGQVFNRVLNPIPNAQPNDPRAAHLQGLLGNVTQDPRSSQLSKGLAGFFGARVAGQQHQAQMGQEGKTKDFFQRLALEMATINEQMKDADPTERQNTLIAASIQNLLQYGNDGGDVNAQLPMLKYLFDSFSQGGAGGLSEKDIYGIQKDAAKAGVYNPDASLKQTLQNISDRTRALKPTEHEKGVAKAQTDFDVAETLLRGMVGALKAVYEEQGGGGPVRGYIAQALSSIAPEFAGKAAYPGQRGESMMPMVRILTNSVRVLDSVLKILERSAPTGNEPQTAAATKMYQTYRNMARITKAYGSMPQELRDSINDLDDKDFEKFDQELGRLVNSMELTPEEEEYIQRSFQDILDNEPSLKTFSFPGQKSTSGIGSFVQQQILGVGRTEMKKFLTDEEMAQLGN